MITAIGNFLVENGKSSSVGLLAGFVILLITIALIRAFLKRLEFVSAWNDIRESVIDNVNSKGLTAINLLIEIAMISAKKDGYAGQKIGMILQQVLDTKDTPKFYSKVLKFMEGINDNIKTVKLNGDYAQIRNSIEAATELIKIIPRASMLWFNDLGKVRDPVDKKTSDFLESNNYLTDFMTLTKKAFRAEKDITQAIARIEKILSDLKSQEAIIEEEEILLSAGSDAK